MKSDEIDIMPTSSSPRINRRVRTGQIRLSRNLYHPDSGQWFLSHSGKFIDGMWTQGQMFIDQNNQVCFAWNEEYQVDMREIYQERMVTNARHAAGWHAGCVAH